LRHVFASSRLQAWLQSLLAAATLSANAAVSTTITHLGPVTDVPEPETSAMLLAGLAWPGLGLLGAIARRRGRKSADLPAVMQECPFRHLNGLENRPQVPCGL
jgi:hypothetical protein